MMQEMLGTVHKKFAQTDWLPGAVLASVLAVVPWTYMILKGSIATIWPLFGMANQMLACVALCVGTTFIINSGRARYSWVTILPLTFVSVIEITAGYQNIADNYLPKQLYLNAGITVCLMVGLVIVILGSARKWYRVAIKGEPHQPLMNQPLMAGQD
jgi:carbon starvation protein